MAEKKPALRILLITIKRDGYNMILKGDKREEYRAVTDYWSDRLEDRAYDAVRFQNGYASNSPSFLIRYKGFRIGYPKKKWGGDPDEMCYVIKLGELIT